MDVQPALHVLSGFLLEWQGGKLQPAVNDVSGKPLFAAERLLAAQILAQQGARFLCVGCSEQTEYLKRALPGGGHCSVPNPELFTANTLGNIDQAKVVIGRLQKTVAVLNLYHVFRWNEWSGIRCLPAEAVLVANQVLGSDDLPKIFGFGAVANKLIDITLASAERIACGGDGCMIESELRAFEDIIALLPSSRETGPARDQVSPALRSLFTGHYGGRLLDELIGVGDWRGGSYKSFRSVAEVFENTKAA